jgi:hypothetical protein
MRSEVVVAIVVGSLLGLTIAFGLWRANSALSTKRSSQGPTPTASQNAPNGLTIAAPDDFEVLTQTPAVITGISSFGYLVVVSAEEEDYFLTPSPDGAFEVEAELIAAANRVVISAFDPQGGRAEKRLNLALSTEFAKIASSPTPTTQEEEVEATDSVREKVQEKVSAARSSPKFILGSITDKLETTLEVKTQKGEIEQITASDENTTFIKMDKTKKEVKYADVAIGDFVLAMGFRNGNGVLEARRILITTALEETTRRAVLGTISEATKTQATFEALGQEEKLTITDSKNLTLLAEVEGEEQEIDFTFLESGQKVVVVGEVLEGKFVVRTLRVLSQ